MSAPKILVFAASTRKESFNRRLAAVIARKSSGLGASITELDLRDHALPIYDGDFEAAQGVPEAGQTLHALFRTHHGIFIASPEYNAGVTPLLANVLAWVSRVTTHGGMQAAFGTPVFALGSASPGRFGGYRGLMALRQSLVLQLGAQVLPAMVSLGEAPHAFDDAGNLAVGAQDQMASRLVDQFLDALAPHRASSDAGK